MDSDKVTLVIFSLRIVLSNDNCYLIYDILFGLSIVCP